MRKKTPKGLNLLTHLLLTYLMAITNFLPTKARLAKKTRTTQAVLGNKKAKKVVTIAPLQQMLMPRSSKRNEKMSSKLSASTVTGKGITPPSVPRKNTKKTSVGLGNFHASD